MLNKNKELHMYRQKMSRGNSRRTFTKHAVKKNSKNFRGNPMRGGIRL